MSLKDVDQGHISRIQTIIKNLDIFTIFTLPNFYHSHLEREERTEQKKHFFFAQFSLLFPNSSSHLVQRTHLNVPTHAHGNDPCQEKCAAEESDLNDVHHTVS